MDFALDPDQTLLVDTATAFLRNLDESADRERLWRDVTKLGWTGLVIAEADGGVGGSLLDAVLLVEQLGYAAAVCPFVSSAVVGSVVLSDAGRRAELAELAAGRSRVALAFSEEGGEFTPQSVRLSVDGEALSGTKRFVKDADAADALIVAARSSDGILC